MHSAPSTPCPEICFAWTFVGRIDSITPVIAVSETSSGEANYRGLILRICSTIRFGCRRCSVSSSFPDPDPVVNNATQVLREVPIDVGRNDANLLAHQHFNTARGAGPGGFADRPRNSIRPQAANDPWRRNSRRSIMMAFPSYRIAAAYCKRSFIGGEDSVNQIAIIDRQLPCPKPRQTELGIVAALSDNESVPNEPANPPGVAGSVADRAPGRVPAERNSRAGSAARIGGFSRSLLQAVL